METEAQEKDRSKEGPEEGLNEDRVRFMSREEFAREKSRNPSIEIEEKAFFEDKTTGSIFEQCFDGEDVFYAYISPSGSHCLTDPSATIIPINGKHYAPIDDDLLRAGQVLLPSGLEEYGDDLTLFQDVKNFLDKYHDQPNERERVIDVLYVFLTYIADLLPVVPYRRVIGGLGRGKTLWRSVMSGVVYRGVNISGASTIASLRRYLNTWRGTLVVDEANFYKTDLHADLVKMINLGHSRRDGWLTLCDQENNPVLLNVFGPKIFASREELYDEAAESRFITFNAKKSTQDKPIYLTEPFDEAAQHLRNKLLLWRFRNYRKFEEKVAELEDVALHALFEASIDHRIKQIFTPLYLIADETLKPTLNEVVKKLHEGLEDRDEDAALATAIRAALFGSKDKDGNEKPGMVSVVSYSSSLEEHPKVKLIDITNRILGDNADPKERRRMGRKIANLLRHEFEYRVVKGHGNYAYVIVPVSGRTTKATNHANHTNPNPGAGTLDSFGACELCGRDGAGSLTGGRFVCRGCQLTMIERSEGLLR